ncbi:UNVERIFIED_ORG: uncharacterized SAM-binding protein YcdF (DUF218 family) [Methylobacterium sp. SuP10 SLI 274]|nr:uncharacterized SAM-binding protein YcdF (DUF218 family) [Methylorubrum extorquens]MDF9864907.1 uncharacterized SAM-binding protein YcdF (DUF218 family) [Methylorubrum pseudosasae]MDH6638482.1 uncharacterized SAM-binding protein YcdF (DUF218 family) [Methylobacterium sp. SuP10 SLI 274]MDH6667667.1 uncharacterized SAM-binding protein YcdF (DUF218 family) [Methylorubrum zatmanii]
MLPRVPRRQAAGPGRLPNESPSESHREALGWSWVADLSAYASSQPSAARMIEAPARPGRGIRLLRAFVGLSLLGLLALAGGFLAFVAVVERTDRPGLDGVDGIVAMTGGSQRVGDAIDLLAEGHGRRLLISGVNERTTRDEIVRLNPSQEHWITCCVDLDYRARNTIGNAIETRRWMRRHSFGTVVVVTSNYHMPRTLVELRHALKDGETLIPYPVVSDGLDVSRWWADPAVTRLLGAEYLKFLVAWGRTRFESDPEQSRFAVLIGRRQPVKVVAERLLREAN